MAENGTLLVVVDSRESSSRGDIQQHRLHSHPRGEGDI